MFNAVSQPLLWLEGLLWNSEQIPLYVHVCRECKLSAMSNTAGASQATSTAQLQQDFASVVETMKAWMPMLQAQILQQNYQGSTSASGNSGKRKQEQQAAFKLELYNYYVDKSAKALPTKIQCMITHLSLQASDVVAAHVWPKSRLMVCLEAYCAYCSS